MRFTKKMLVVLIPVMVVGTIIAGSAVFAGWTIPIGPTAPWRMAGDWGPLVQPAPPMTATANTRVNVRSTPTQRPNGWAAGISNANVIGGLNSGQVVDIINYEVVRAWVYTDVSRRSDIGYTGPSRWINIRTSSGLVGWVYIAFLDF